MTNPKPHKIGDILLFDDYWLDTSGTRVFKDEKSQRGIRFEVEAVLPIKTGSGHFSYKCRPLSGRMPNGAPITWIPHTRLYKSK